MLNPTKKPFFDFDKDEFEAFEEDEIEDIINQDSEKKRLQVLKKLVKKAIWSIEASCAIKNSKGRFPK